MVGGRCPLCSIDATGEGALCKPLQLNWGEWESGCSVTPFFFSLLNLSIFSEFHEKIFLRGAPLSRGARGHLPPTPPCKFGPDPLAHCFAHFPSLYEEDFRCLCDLSKIKCLTARSWNSFGQELNLGMSQELDQVSFHKQDFRRLCHLSKTKCSTTKSWISFGQEPNLGMSQELDQVLFYEQDFRCLCHLSKTKCPTTKSWIL